MAAVFKCTKVILGGLPSPGSGQIGTQVYYVDPTTTPPTPYSSYRAQLITDLESAATTQTNFDVAVAADQGGDTIDWAL